MFKVIYEKDTGKVLQIVHTSDVIIEENDMLDAYIVVNELPSVREFYQGYIVRNNMLEVIDYQLTEDQRLTYRLIELQREINELKNKLSSSDYQAIKYFEGVIDINTFLTIKQERQSWRNSINNLETELINVQNALSRV